MDTLQQHDKIEITGKCVFCGDTFNKRAMSRHLKTCKARKRRIEEADQATKDSKQKPEKLFTLQITEVFNPYYYFLYLEIPAKEKLQTLDKFLRRIWLECCGHLSAFEIEGKRYSQRIGFDDFDFDELFVGDMKFSLGQVLKPDTVFVHEYDFGSTTELRLKVLEVREGIKLDAKNPIFVMSRNDPPQFMCGQCGKNLATIVCTFCLWNSTEGWLCDICKTEHQCFKDEGDDYMFLPVVNSPRVGVCGYTGDTD